MPSPWSAADLWRGIALVCLAAFLFTSTHAVIKALSAGYPVTQIVFFRSACALLVLGPLLLRAGPDSFRTRRPGLHAVRSLSGVVSMAIFFYALQYRSLAELTAINFTMPLFVTALSMPLLREAVGWRRWTAVAVGFGGVLLMVQPGAAGIDWIALLALFGAFLYALAVIAMRLLGSTERSSTITLYFTLTSAIASGLFLPFQWVTPGWADLGLLVMIGVVGGVAQLAMTAAYRLAPAGIVAPFDYTALVWAALWGFLAFGELPDITVWAGAGVIVASGLYILYRETTLANARRTLPKAG